MKALCVIPARADSKRIARKNMQMICGVPLVGHAINCAMEVPEIQYLVVTTNDHEVEEYCRTRPDHGERPVTVLWRPEELCGDDTKTEAVIVHALDQFRDLAFDAVVVLQPTSPQRIAHDVRMCLLRLDRGTVDAVISMTDAPADSCFAVVNPTMRMLRDPDVMVPNGAVYALRPHVIRERRSWYDRAVAYVMPPDRSIDINTPGDLERVRAIMEEK